MSDYINSIKAMISEELGLVVDKIVALEQKKYFLLHFSRSSISELRELNEQLRALMKQIIDMYHVLSPLARMDLMIHSRILEREVDFDDVLRGLAQVWIVSFMYGEEIDYVANETDAEINHFIKVELGEKFYRGDDEEMELPF